MKNDALYVPSLLPSTAFSPLFGQGSMENSNHMMSTGFSSPNSNPSTVSVNQSLPSSGVGSCIVPVFSQGVALNPYNANVFGSSHVSSSSNLPHASSGIFSDYNVDPSQEVSPGGQLDHGMFPSNICQSFPPEFASRHEMDHSVMTSKFVNSNLENGCFSHENNSSNGKYPFSQMSSMKNQKYPPAQVNSFAQHALGFQELDSNAGKPNYSWSSYPCSPYPEQRFVPTATGEFKSYGMKDPIKNTPFPDRGSIETNQSPYNSSDLRSVSLSNGLTPLSLMASNVPPFHEKPSFRTHLDPCTDLANLSIRTSLNDPYFASHMISSRRSDSLVGAESFSIFKDKGHGLYQNESNQYSGKYFTRNKYPDSVNFDPSGGLTSPFPMNNDERPMYMNMHNNSTLSDLPTSDHSNESFSKWSQMHTNEQMTRNSSETMAYPRSISHADFHREPYGNGVRRAPAMNTRTEWKGNNKKNFKQQFKNRNSFPYPSASLMEENGVSVFSPEYITSTEGAICTDNVHLGNQPKISQPTECSEQNLRLGDLKGQLHEFALNRDSSRLLQSLLNTATENEISDVLDEFLLNSVEIITNRFGNYVVQRLLDKANPMQQMRFIQFIREHIAKLTNDPSGCRVIQKCIQCLPSEGIDIILDVLRRNILDYIEDEPGTHVTQKCVEVVPEKCQFIENAFIGKVVKFSMHAYGCRVIQTLLSCRPSSKVVLLDEIFYSLPELVEDWYGNYVIQYLIENSTVPTETTTIYEFFKDSFYEYSMQKCASNVMEKIFVYISPERRDYIINSLLESIPEGKSEFCGNDDEGRPIFRPASKLFHLVCGQFGNYVVQRMLNVVNAHQKETMIYHIRLFLIPLGQCTYGRHMVARFEKLYSSSFNKKE